MVRIGSKARRIMYHAFAVLILLMSHETISVANKIRDHANRKEQFELHDTITKAFDIFDIENLSFDKIEDQAVDVVSFIQTESLNGMTTEEYATFEIKEMHKSLNDAFSFQESPIKNDLQHLKEIPENTILSRSELKSHREHITLLLEKAMSHVDLHVNTNLDISAVPFGDGSGKAKGTCKNTNWITTCDSEQNSRKKTCKSDENDPCTGTCVCDTVGVNTCECVVSRDSLQKARELAKVKPSTVIDNKKVEKAFDVPNIGKSAIYGLIDGFFGGFISEAKEGWQDDACQRSTSLNLKLKAVPKKLKYFWHNLKSVHRKIFTKNGRAHLIKSLKKFLSSLAIALKGLYQWSKHCPAMQMLSMISFVLLGLVLLNVVFFISGAVVGPIIVKIAGGLLGLYMSFAYMKKTVKAIWKDGIVKITKGTCGHTCKLLLVEKSFAMIGAILEIILLGGIKDFAKLSKNPKAASIFKKYKIQQSDSLVTDISKLTASVKNAKRGAKQNLHKLADKLKSGQNADNMKSLKHVDEAAEKAESAKKLAWDNYLERKTNEGKVPWSKERWNKNYDQLVEAREAKKIKKVRKRNPKVKNTLKEGSALLKASKAALRISKRGLNTAMDAEDVVDTGAVADIDKSTFGLFHAKHKFEYSTCPGMCFNKNMYRCKDPIIKNKCPGSSDIVCCPKGRLGVQLYPVLARRL